MTQHEPIRILCVNTHVGDSLRLGGFKKVRRRKKPNVVMLQEVQRPGARARARLMHNPLFWINAGLLPKSDGHGSSGTLVFVKRSRFKKVNTSNILISAYLDRWHPERRITRLVVRDRKTDKVWRFLSAHTWTLGKPPPGKTVFVREEHLAQVDAYALQLQRADKKDQSAVAAGDWNERVGSGDSYVEKRMGTANASSARPEPGGRPSLDEAFVTSLVDVLAYEKISQDELDTDHDGLYLEVAA